MVWVGGFHEWRVGDWVGGFRGWCGSVGVMDGVIGDGVGWWVSWMAWVSGLAMAWVSGLAMAGLEHKINSGLAMAGLLSLDQAQMVGLMVVWVCVVIGGWLFFGSGKVDCAVCVVVVGWIVPFGSGV